MLENGKISIRQFTILVICFSIGSSILIVPSILATAANQDAWIAAILGIVLSIPLVYLYSVLGKRYQQLTIIQYNEKILGKWLGRGISLLLISYIFLLSSALLLEIGDFVTTQFMPETPIQAVQILFAVLVIMGTRLGLETLARAAEIFFPWVVLLLIIMIASISPEIKLENIQPILENGGKPVVYATYILLGLPFLELITLLMIFPYINQIKQAGNAFMIGSVIGGFFILFITATSILVIGADQTSRQLYPSYVIAKMINIGDFLQRIEVIMAGIWFLTIYFKLTICFYASVIGIAQTFQLKDYRFLTLPAGMILIIFPLISSPNIVYFQQFLATTWTPLSLTFGLLLPLLLLIVSTIRESRKTKENDQCSKNL